MFIRLSAVQPSVPVVVKRSVISHIELEPIPDTIESIQHDSTNIIVDQGSKKALHLNSETKVDAD